MARWKLTESSPWSPLLRPEFRRVWGGSLVTNIGFWVQSVGGTWLMTTLTNSPLLIALMQAAMSLPFLLVGIPAGALADTIDRRQMLLATQFWMALSAVALALFTLAGYMDPTLLLLLTFSLGVGNAMNAPVWQACVPELAGRERLAKAVAMNGVGFNIARVIGPAIGGLLVAETGVAPTFVAYALCFVFPIAAIAKWKREKIPAAGMPAERTLGAMRAGIRYFRHSRELQSVLVRAALFTVFASALWALLPSVTRQLLGGGPHLYGLHLGCLGAGSVVAVGCLPWLRRRFPIDRIMQGAALLFAGGTAALAFARNEWVLCPLLVCAGFGWLSTMVSVNVSTQSVAPTWVQARALSFYVLFSQGGLAIGSFFWGSVASQFGLVPALACAAFGLLFGVVAVYFWPLSEALRLDVAPASNAMDAELAAAARPSDGPVLVTVAYKVAPGNESDFREAIRSLERVRRRDGAIRWELYRDLESPGRYVETFVVESWAEHLRQHGRFTKSDVDVRRVVRTFHASEEKPHVEHLLYERVHRRDEWTNFFRDAFGRVATALRRSPKLP